MAKENLRDGIGRKTLLALKVEGSYDLRNVGDFEGRKR